MCRVAVLVDFFNCFSSFSFSCLLIISFRNFAISPSLFFVMISCRVFSLNSLFIFVSLFTFKQVQSVFFNITCFTFYVFIVGFYNYHSGQHHKYCSCFIKMEIFQIFVVIVRYHIFLYFLYLFLFLLIIDLIYFSFDIVFIISVVSPFKHKSSRPTHMGRNHFPKFYL